MKLLAAGAFGTMALRIIGKPSELLSKIQFKGFTPTLNQFKFVYGLTIMSRLLSARDQNELRESSIKDTLGFLNWLVLGNFVAKLTASGLEKMIGSNDKALLNHNEKENGKGFFNWLTQSSIKTRDEVLHAELKKVGVETVKEGKAIPIKELLKLATEHAPIAKTKIKYLNLAQVVGYAYSGLVLGVGIPKLNIAITNGIEKKRKAKQEHKHEQPSKVETEKAKV